MEEHLFEFNGWKYISRIYGSGDDFGKPNLKFELELDIPDDISVPSNLTKYYLVNSYSVKSFLKNELYASHPYQLNDPFDCYHGLIDFSSMTLQDYITYFTNIKDNNEVEELYDNDRNKLNFELSLLHGTFTYCRIGIISMSEIDNDMCMWAHYSDSHNGFAIKFHTEQIEKQFYGPFPINYVNQFEKIDILKNGVILSFFYQSSIKSIKWKFEKEWRLIGEKEQMIIPGLHEPFNARDRCFNYSKSAIKEIILGFNFFKCLIKHRISQSARYRILFVDKNELKYQILREIYENYNDRFYLMELDPSNKFELTKLKIIIEKVENLEIIINFAA